MYEQSIPALAYIFIGITSLVVTYSQINQKGNVEETNTMVSQPTEVSSENIREPQQETYESTDPPSMISQPDENSISANEADEENKIGGKRRTKRKSRKSIKKVVKNKKRKSLRQKK